jgi:hypothetical protein
MKTFEEFRNASTIADKPVYVRKDGELSYDIAEDVYAPGIGIGESQENFLARMKILRNAHLPEDWEGIK